jgi:hypothetical protein
MQFPGRLSLAVTPRHGSAMHFHAIITLNDHHLAAAGLSDQKTAVVATSARRWKDGRRGLD